MPNSISPQLLSQIFAQESTDPFLTLITLSHPAWSEDVRIVKNIDNVTSRGLVYQAFPVEITLPVDDGETMREVSMNFDNVSLMLIGKFRMVTKDIKVKLEMVLASIPDEVQVSLEDLVIQGIVTNRLRISAKLSLDNFLNTEMTSERYTPKNFPGIF